MSGLIVDQGATATFTGTLRGEDDRPLAGVYTGLEALALQLWTGDDQGEIALAGSTVGWLIAAQATIAVMIHQTDTAALSPGKYHLRVLLISGGRTVVAARVTLIVRAGPGSATAAPVYASARDLTDAVPWIEEIQDDDDQTGFAEQRAVARQWLDARIAGACQVDLRWIEEQLAADRLMLTTVNGRRLVRAVSLYAASEVLKHQTGGRDKTNSYAGLGLRLRNEAESLVSQSTAELDLNADGVADVRIPMGFIPVLRG